MPTLNYEMEVTCGNCGKDQKIKLPVGSPLLAFGETAPIPGTKYGILNNQSGYKKNYGKAEKTTVKRCESCRTAMLVRKEVSCEA